jgi:hypothetical protein
MTHGPPIRAAALAALCLVLAATGAAAARRHRPPPKPRAYASAEGNVSFLGQLASGESAVGSAAYRLVAGLGGIRVFDFFVAVEHGFWRDDEGSAALSIQALDVGLGAGATYFGGRVRSEISTGPSILLSRSQLDEPGTVGFFVDVRPAGYRWHLGDHAVVSLYPLTFAFVAPVPDGIPLVYISYRTALVLEWGF